LEEKMEEFDCDDDDIDDVEAPAPRALPEVRAFAETSKSYSVVADATEVIPLDVVEEQYPAAAAAGYYTTTNHYQYHNNMYNDDDGGGDGDMQIEAIPLSSSSLSTKPYCSSVQLWTKPTTATTSATTSTTTTASSTTTTTTPVDVMVTQRPSLISVSLFKASRDTKLGISFTSCPNQGKLLVSKITSHGLLGGGAEGGEGCGIRPGDGVLTMNNVYCARWNPQMALRQLQSISGKINLVVSAATSTADVQPKAAVAAGAAGAATTEEEKDEGEEIGDPDAEEDHDDVENSKTVVVMKEVINPNLIQATVIKLQPTDRLGIGFENVAGRLRISSLNPHGLLGGADNSALSVGDYMVSINGIPCADMAYSRAKELVLKSPNRVTLMAISPTPHTTTATTASNTTSTSTSTTNTTPNPTDIYIISTRNVLTDLLSSPTTLAHDEDPVLPMARAVSNRRSLTFPNSHNNGTSSNSNSNDYSSSSLDIHPAYYSVMVVKPTLDMQLGIQFKEVNGMAVISHIAPGSMVATSTPLRIGLAILSINNTHCTTPQQDNEPIKDSAVWGSIFLFRAAASEAPVLRESETKKTVVTEAYRLLREAQGELVLVAQDLSDTADPNYVHASATKLDPRAPLGIVFGSSNGSLYITSVQPTGIFASSVLNPDDRVLSMNNVPCRHFTITDAVAFVRDESRETISIVACRSHSTCVVVSQLDGPSCQEDDIEELRQEANDTNNNNDHHQQQQVQRTVWEQTFKTDGGVIQSFLVVVVMAFFYYMIF
jgi:hypothetical protein